MKINYLTWLSRDLSRHTEILDVPTAINTLESLIEYQIGRGGVFEGVFSKKHVIFASVNNKVLSTEETISSEMEITFFAPIVGG